MKHLNITSYLFAFLLLFGTVFIVQCERDTREADTDDQYEIEQDLTVDPEDRRYDGTGVEGPTYTEYDHTTLEFDDRDDLVESMEELRDDLDAKIDDESDAADHDIEQIQNDLTELNRMIREVETATEDNWNDIRMEVVQTYESIAARYNGQSRTGNNR